MWQSAHNSILMNEARKQRNFAPIRECARCMVQTKISLHALRDCNEAFEVWKCLLPYLSRPFFSF